MIRRFFFYGTLMAGMGNRHERAAHALLDEGRAAVVRGRLYAVPDRAGWYPALLPGAGAVRGMVHGAQGRFDARAMARMDAYEGREYRRCRIKLGANAADAYVWRGPLPRGACRIASGDFRGWLAARRGRRAYRA
ncbi:gamma-glutamylcyclotransferase family protein [Novosphingobium sp. KACC 22771]|uniref:gamma-glutamylcyclotransferase family protein n=1 Tax=Novosphingobium sp. KACC 22771 TaxID=3025670 RepID=UPI002365DEFA|nr:gamma-glutamylcyclotransferase family protein [Novosphingobium sp. KACC 22771]WDF72419.1 gamma-glutamylcyclotransferase [Novosphingobium sp. KACC 22771]